MMRFALDVAPLGELADPRAIVALAESAEAAGWDGLSVWDSLGVSMGAPAVDPFLALAAAASATERLALIASVIALPRRRPQLVAQSAASLDRLSGGRFVLGIGAGGDPGDFAAFGEPTEMAERLVRFDEAAELVDAFLRGEKVTHRGRVFTVEGVSVGPEPARRPRPPIWVGALRRGGIRRAARWDGWIAITIGEDGSTPILPPDAFAEEVAWLRSERDATGRGGDAFDVAVFGQAGTGGHRPGDYEAAGATWWLESVSGMRGTLDDLLAIAAAGPPHG